MASEGDTRDIAEVAATVLTSEGHKGQSYPLAGPESLGGEGRRPHKGAHPMNAGGVP